jgi:hypothetical protein
MEELPKFNATQGSLSVQIAASSYLGIGWEWKTSIMEVDKKYVHNNYAIQDRSCLLPIFNLYTGNQGEIDNSEGVFKKFKELSY